MVKVREHIFGDCTNSFASVTKKPHAVLDDRYIQRYTFEREFSFKVSTFLWAGKYFFLSIIKGERPYANFYVQMLGEEEECRKILVTLSVRDQVVDCFKHSFCLWQDCVFKCLDSSEFDVPTSFLYIQKGCLESNI